MFCYSQNAMIMQDKLEKERCDAKNAVEEYVYEMRDKLCGPYEDFCKEEVWTWILGNCNVMAVVLSFLFRTPD